MTTDVLLRHGRTTANAEGVLAGDTPVELDEQGIAQAQAAAARLSVLPLAEIVTSPLLRCLQTVSYLDRPYAVEPELTECGYGEWSGRKISELAGEPLWRDVQQHPAAVVFPGGEAMAAMASRAVAAIRSWDRRIAETHGSDAIWLACSHGDVIKAIVADAMGLHLDLFQRIHVGPGSLTVIRYTAHRPFLWRLSDSGDDLSALAPTPSTPDDPATEGDAPIGGGAA